MIRKTAYIFCAVFLFNALRFSLAPSPGKLLPKRFFSNAVKNRLGQERPDFPSCRDASAYFLPLLTKKFAAEDTYGMQEVLGNWLYYCKTTQDEYLLRGLILSKLMHGGDYPLSPYEWLTFQQYQASFPYMALTDDSSVGTFNSLTRDFALSQIKQEKNKNNAYLYYYAGNFSDFFHLVRTGKYPAAFYALMSHIEALKRVSSPTVGFYSGLWQPTGANSILGTHPIIGLFAGFGNSYWEIALHLNFYFLDSKNSYVTYLNSAPYQTNTLIGGYLGLDYTYFFYNRGSFYLGGLFGVGFDGFNTLNKSDQHEHRSVNSANFNLGLSARYFLSNRREWFIFSNLRYNIVDYDNSPGTDLSGNTVTFYIGAGFVDNDSRAHASKQIMGF